MYTSKKDASVEILNIKIQNFSNLTAVTFEIFLLDAILTAVTFDIYPFRICHL